MPALALTLHAGLAAAQDLDAGAVDVGALDVGALDVGADAAPRDQGPPPPLAGRGLRGHYFNSRDLTGEPTSRVDGPIFFPFGAGGPGVGSLGADNFSIRWEGTVVPTYSERYTFFTYSDDGVRLWVDGQLLIDNWTGHARTRDAGEVTLRANTPATILLEFFEASGDAVIELGWSSDTQPEEIVPAAALRPGPVFTPSAPTTVHLVVGQDRATEGAGEYGRFTIYRWGPLGRALEIPLVLGGDAEEGLDFEPLPPAITLGAHEHARTFDIVPTEDELYRGARLLELRAGPGEGYTVGSEPGRVTILDDERPPAPPAYTISGEVEGAPPGAIVLVEVSGAANGRRALLGDGRFAIGQLGPGRYQVEAFADTDGDGAHDPGEPVAWVEGVATFSLDLPPDSPLLRVVFPPDEVGAPDDAGGRPGAGEGPSAGDPTADGGPEVPTPRVGGDGGGCATTHPPAAGAILALCLLGYRRRRAASTQGN